MTLLADGFGFLLTCDDCKAVRVLALLIRGHRRSVRAGGSDTSATESVRSRIICARDACKLSGVTSAETGWTFHRDC
jgi:hypothetical protein